MNFRPRNFFGEFAQFVATLRRHGHVQFRAARGMPHLVVFESADERIFSVKDARARRDVLRDTLKIIRLEAALAWCEIGLRSTINFGRSGSSNASIRVAREVWLKIKTGVL